MVSVILKTIVVLTLNLVICFPIYAKALEQKKINFEIKTKELIQGEVHYFYQTFSPRTLYQEIPEFFEIDSLSLGQGSDVRLVATKSIFVVKRPVGFFDDKQMVEDRFMNHMMSSSKIKRLSPASFSISVQGENSHTYKWQSFFDADDVSTLPNSKVTKAVNAVKKIDVISQSASSIMLTESTQFSKYFEGRISISSFIPIKENKTMIITYNLISVKKQFFDENKVREVFIRDTLKSKKLLESFKE